MSYDHIDNLYKNQKILSFKRVFALEKVHGTSAHIMLPHMRFHAGGAPQQRFEELFDYENLAKVYKATWPGAAVVVHGEAYGGKIQKMGHVYGKELRFIVFDIKIDDHWLSVPNAADVAYQLDLEFVPYLEISTEMDEIDTERTKPSVVAGRRGMGTQEREGIVLRPPFEVTLNNGDRVCAKYKNPGFEERATPPKVVDAARLQVLEDAQAIAEEWVTDMRLAHVLDQVSQAFMLPITGMENTGEVIKFMVADIEREAAGEIVMSREARAAIGKKTVKLFKDWLERRLHND